MTRPRLSLRPDWADVLLTFAFGVACVVVPGACLLWSTR